MPPLSKKLGQTRRFLFWETFIVGGENVPSGPGLVPNSRHKWLKGFSRREAATTNFTRCSLTSIVFHGIPAHTPALASPGAPSFILFFVDEPIEWVPYPPRVSEGGLRYCLRPH